MKKYLLASVLIVGLVTPALAEQFYVAFDPASHKCTMMHNIPAAPMKIWVAPISQRRREGHARHEGLHRLNFHFAQAYLHWGLPLAGPFHTEVESSLNGRRCWTRTSDRLRC